MPTLRPLANAIAVDKLGLPLADWIADQRDAGLGWEVIEANLTEATGGIITVHWTTLRRWHLDKEIA